MSRTALPTRRTRWRSAAAGVAIAFLFVTTAACGEGAGEDEGVVEEDTVEQEDEGEEDD